MDEADDRPRLTPRDTEEGFGVLALRRAPGARSLSTVFGGRLSMSADRQAIVSALRDAQAWAAVSVRALATPEINKAVHQCSFSWLAGCLKSRLEGQLEAVQMTEGPPLGPANLLRTAALSPPDLYHHREGSVSFVVARRRLLVAALAAEAEVDVRGRLLAYLPDMNLADGAARFASRGFFDDDNTPPWDTWVAYVRREGSRSGDVLLAWVPVALVDLADAGIAVNPEGCVGWLEAHAHQDVTADLSSYVSLLP